MVVCHLCLGSSRISVRPARFFQYSETPGFFQFSLGGGFTCAARHQQHRIDDHQSQSAKRSVGMAYSFTFAADGGLTPYSWSVASGVLPAGLKLDTGGSLTGTPTAAGQFAF